MGYISRRVGCCLRGGLKVVSRVAEHQAKGGERDTVEGEERERVEDDGRRQEDGTVSKGEERKGA